MAQRATWVVEFYTDARGKSPVVEFIDSLPHRDQTRLARAMMLLQEFGIYVDTSVARSLTGYKGLWELRAGRGRLFYFLHTDRRFVILHGYYKKSQRAPRREIEVAVRRMTEFLERGK